MTPPQTPADLLNEAAQRLLQLSGYRHARYTPENHDQCGAAQCQRDREMVQSLRAAALSAVPAPGDQAAATCETCGVEFQRPGQTSHTCVIAELEAAAPGDDPWTACDPEADAAYGRHMTELRDTGTTDWFALDEVVGLRLAAIAMRAGGDMRRKANRRKS